MLSGIIKKIEKDLAFKTYAGWWINTGLAIDKGRVSLQLFCRKEVVCI